MTSIKRDAQTISSKRLPTIALILGLIAVIAGLALWWILNRGLETTDNASVESDIILVSPSMSGMITRVLVTENQVVYKGQILAIIDASEYAIKRDSTVARVDEICAMREQLKKRRAVEVALAQEQQAVLRSKQALLYAAATHRRRETALTKFGWGTGERMDNAIAADISADAAVDQAYAAIKSEEAQVGVLNAEDQTLSAREAAARSEVSLNQSYLDRSEVRSPTGGKLGQVLVKIGEFVKPGDVLLQLVPTGNRYVIANFKETQISKMAVGQEVTVTLDAFPGERFAGKIASFSPATGSKFAALPIDNANGNFLKIVQRRRVRIELKDFPNSDTRLLPGLSARVQVHVG